MAEYLLHPSFHFRVEFTLNKVSGVDAEMRFQEVSGLNKNLDVEELKEGGENRFAYKLPNPGKYPNLVLKRGMLTDSELINWCFRAIDNFEFEPADVTVILLNEEHKPLSRWTFAGAYPVKWSVNDFKGQENAIAVESLELAYKYWTKSDE